MEIDVNKIIPNFFRYAIPSIVAMITSGIFVIVDGIFVGNATGDAGLAAINIAFPLYTCFSASGIGIGSGGAVLMSMNLGAKNENEAEKILGCTLLMQIIVGILFTTICGIFCTPILKFFGASDEIFKITYDYGFTVVLGGVFIVLGSGISPLIRNDGSPRKCMYITITGLITNIILDYLFIMVFNLGLFGAALATVVGQVITCIIGLSHFILKKSHVVLKKENLKVSKDRIQKILLIGSSPMGTSLAVGAMTIMFNWQSLNFGGDMGVAAFCTISYAIAPLRLLLEGIGDGLQPLSSFYHGAGLIESEKRTLRVAYIFAIIMGIIGGVTLFLFSDKIPYVFGASQDLAHIISKGVKIDAICFGFMALCKVSSSYFYSVGKPGYAAILIYGDTFFMMPLGLVTLPLIFDINGVWGAYSNTYIILGLISILLMRKFYIQRRNADIEAFMKHMDKNKH